MNKEEKERKEAAAKAEFERRMRQLQATGAPSADDLLKSVGSIPLSPGDSLESNPIAVVAPPQDDFPEQPQPPRVHSHHRVLRRLLVRSLPRAV